MATLQKIRNNGPLIAIVIGGALLAFILGDMIRQGKSIMGAKKTHIAVVNDKSIDVNEYENRIQETEEYVKLVQGVDHLEEQTSQQIRSSVWDMTIRETILDDTYNELGLTVSKAELEDMTIGNNIHPLVRQTFVNPETGQFDKNVVIAVVQNQDKEPRYKALLNYIEGYIKQDRIYQKYITLVSKGLYTTKLEVEEDNNERKTLYNIDLVGKTIADITDDQISYTDEDLQKYYDEHKNLFKNSVESRDIEYVAFNVYPSKEDTIASYEKALKIKADFEQTTDDQNFITLKSSNPQAVRFYSQEELHKMNGLDTIVFSMAKDSVYGPYFAYGSYELVKVLDFAERPDTVDVRHILISPQNPKVGSMLRAQQIADSLLEVLKNGGDFDLLCAKYSDDPGSNSKGGLYEDITDATPFIPEFLDYAFSHNIGELGTIESQYGVHIMDVTRQSEKVQKVKLAFVQISIDASQKTYDDIYTIAMDFLAKISDRESFEQMADSNHYVIREAPDITAGTYSIPGFQKVRDIVRWAFDADENEVSSVFEMPDKYVIAALKNVNHIGYLSLEKVKKQVENSVKQKKKVEKIYNDYFTNANISDIDGLAQKLGTQKLSLPNVSFSAFQLANIGYEPAVLASLTKLEVNKPFGPIKGVNGVYVVKATAITQADRMSEQDLQAAQKRMSQTLQVRAQYQAYGALKDAANIEDRRVNFY